ncbi:MAG: hypothetical protein PHV37_01140 [Candidatus Gastranaerophilales bacterium]|nr:hypothetical protein [Candidatus Gastranaerophilales bacterium]
MLKFINWLFIITICSFGIAMAQNDLPNFNARKAYIAYKAAYMSKDGRIIDSEIKALTTTEGQLYQPCTLNKKRQGNHWKN